MKPDRIFIVRHGESIGNVDRNIYSNVPDYALELTPKGREQARNVGKELKKIIGDRTVQFYVSPFFRTLQTYLGIVQSFPCKKLYIDPRLREQEWGHLRIGDYEDIQNYRDSYGHFYYRFPDGESCADVFDRVSDFTGTMNRDFNKENFPRNAIIVTHGMTTRLLVMRWFHVSVEEFETWSNPANCGYVLLERQEDGKFALKTKMKTHVVKHQYQFNMEKYKKLANE